MFSLTKGDPIAIINKGKTKKFLYVTDNYTGTNDTIKLQNDTFFELIPDKPRFSYFIAGPSGVGKSTLASGLIQKYHKMYPESKIIMFSRCKVDEDMAYSKIKNFTKQIEFTEIVGTSLEYDEENMLFIFDDVTSIIDDKERKSVFDIIVDILEVGRKKKINIIITSHLINNSDKKLNRTIMNECSNIIFFPGSGTVRNIAYFLKEYLGKSKKEIDELIKIKSRWVLLHLTHPQYFISEYIAGSL